MAKNKIKSKYQEYLESDKWKKLRAQARNRAGGKCEFCDGPPEHVHHVKYQKRMAKTPDMLCLTL